MKIFSPCLDSLTVVFYLFIAWGGKKQLFNLTIKMVCYSCSSLLFNCIQWLIKQLISMYTVFVHETVVHTCFCYFTTNKTQVVFFTTHIKLAIFWKYEPLLHILMRCKIWISWCCKRLLHDELFKSLHSQVRIRNTEEDHSLSST